MCLHSRSCVYKRGMCLQTCVYIRVYVSTNGACVYKRVSAFAFVCLQTGHVSTNVCLHLRSLCVDAEAFCAAAQVFGEFVGGFYSKLFKFAFKVVVDRFVCYFGI